MMQTTEYSVLQQQPTMINEYPGSMVLDCPECGGQALTREASAFACKSGERFTSSSASSSCSGCNRSGGCSGCGGH